MQDNQKFSPKYWVVHDKFSDDVIIQTASKNKTDCIDKFLTGYGKEYLSGEEMEDKLICFLEQLRFEAILTEIKKVNH